jgi:hypothetical protein
MSVELECAGIKGGLESGDKLAAEDTADISQYRRTASLRAMATLAIFRPRRIIRCRYLLRHSGRLRTVTCAASTSKKRSMELPCLVMCPSRRRFPLEFVRKYVSLWRPASHHIARQYPTDQAVWIEENTSFLRYRKSPSSGKGSS